MKIIKSTGGLKYSLSDEMCNRIEFLNNVNHKLFNNHFTLWDLVDRFIENAENFPNFIGFISFIIISIFFNSKWYIVPIVSLLIYYIAFALTYRTTIYITLLSKPILIYNAFLFRFLIDKVIIIILSIFIIHNVWAGIVYIACELLTKALLLIPLFATYEKRMELNDKLAMKAIEFFTHTMI